METLLLPQHVAAPAPELEVEQWIGTPSPLSALRGRVVVIHAFQMLCPGCVLHGLPQAARIHQQFSHDQVAVIGLHSVFEHHAAMTPTSLRPFLSEFRVPFCVAVDAAGTDSPIPRTMQQYGLRGTPSLLLIDRAGRLRANLFGRPEDLAVGAAIATLLLEDTQTDATHIPDTETVAQTDGCDTESCVLPAGNDKLVR